MVGCSIKNSCANSLNRPNYCDNFSLLADICYADMPLMPSCSNYLKLCGISSQTSVPLAPIFNTSIIQCSNALPITLLPTSFDISNNIKSICSEMSMPGCEKCPQTQNSFVECDMFQVYSQLCKSMPGMQQCKLYNVMCAANKNLSYCEFNQNIDSPSMKMFFHLGMVEFLLFDGGFKNNSRADS